jgi:hypothetical protein
MGFNALGVAQATYWGAVQPSFSPPPPANGDFMHSTSVSISPTNCDQGIVWHVNQTINCVATVADTFGSNFHTPTGTLNWTINSTLVGSCTLTMIDAQSSTCPFSYQWRLGDAGTALLQATYVPTSNHGSSSLLSPLQFTVTAPYRYNFACKNPWQSWTFQVEVGQPLFCTLTVTDSVTGLPAPDGLQVVVTAGSGAGHAYFACFTDDDPTNGAQHGAAYSRMTAPGCAPQQDQPFNCTVTPGTNGLCTNNYSSSPLYGPTGCPAPTCSFVYRRNYDDTGNFTTSDQLKATAPSVGESGTSNPISIVSSLAAQGTATALSCASNVQDTVQIVERSKSITSDSALLSVGGGQLMVSCTASVVDVGLNTAFDFPVCIPPINLHCDIDAEQAQSPIGQVTLTVLDPSGSLWHTYTCNLGHIPPPPPNIATLHPLGAWFESSWCNSYTDETGATASTLTFPFSGPGASWTVFPQYQGSSAHDPSTGPTLAVTVQ